MLASNSLKDKVIIVTGGGTGLGKSMSTYFLELGAIVVITSRKNDVLISTQKELEEQTGGIVFPFVCDVRLVDQVIAMRDAVLAKFGRIDILVNNAAGNFISPTERLSTKAFNIIVDIVLKGTINCTLEIGKHWIESKQTKAKVLNIVTTYAWTGSSYVVPSACAKAGVLAMTRSLAVEWAKYGIWFNAIAPGPFPTKGAWDRLFPKELGEIINLENKNPLKRVGNHIELANLAGYLISDYSDFINGEVVTIDGGEWLMGAGEFNFLNQLSETDWDNIENVVRKAK
ncbi:MAG: SDR family oxidoreductase [Bacteroidetes bacterium]|nr:SDR family oxidoreductase [Bacteroidota bacterium]